jgi:formyltetrahydrofolate deformylase
MLTLTITCPDRVGIVAAVSRFIADRGGWITEANHHADSSTQRFFMRNVMTAASLAEQGVSAAQFRADFAAIARSFSMDWALIESAQKKRVMLLVSRQDHCLVDLLYRWRAGELPAQLVGVISNHDQLRAYVQWHGLAYHHVPVAPDAPGKAAAFKAIDQLCTQARAEVIVLARYMQVLPAWFTRQYPAQIINIHHSFLPSFAGARPYAQAFERGVKLIGATSHYVTEALDEGPIIEQDVVRIDHGDTEDDLIRYGRDIEKTVLARALKYHLEDRVLLNGHRTVVFR